MSDQTIYVAVFNYFGNYEELAARYPNASLVNGDTLCFKNTPGHEISRIMERDGCDYNYSYDSPEEAWRKEVYD